MTGVYAMHIELVSYGNEAITYGNVIQGNMSNHRVRFIIK